MSVTVRKTAPGDQVTFTDHLANYEALSRSLRAVSGDGEAHYDECDRLMEELALPELTERLLRAAEEAFGPGLTQTDLAERIAAVVDGKPRRAAYWLTGESPIPFAVIDKLEAAVAKRRDLDPDGALARLIAEWRAAGLHDAVISASLQAAERKIT